MIDGSVLAIGGDDVRLAADVYDVTTRNRGSGERVRSRVPADSISAMANRLGVQALQALLSEEGGEGVTARAAMSLTTASLPALKAYLEGEAYYRTGGFRPGHRGVRACPGRRPRNGTGPLPARGRVRMG